MPMFDGGMPPQGMPPQGMPQGQPGPQPLMPGQQPQPDAAFQALANQVYQLSQQIMNLQRELMDLRNSKVAMDFAVQRDPEGRIVTISAGEGMR